MQYQSYPKEVLSLVSLELWHRAFIDRKSSIASEFAVPNMSPATTDN